MNFQAIPQVMASQHYVDKAFRAGKKTGRTTTVKGRAMEKVRAVEESLAADLAKVVSAFPSFDNLIPFYKELFTIALDIDEVKKALASVQWAMKKVKALSRDHTCLIGKSHENSSERIMKAYYGRVASVMARMDKHLRSLESARRKMKDFPDVKDLFTVCIAGFPNVGKSTLLGKLTPAKPEIRAYAFTTKGLNIGYIKHHYGNVQVVDTPGSLNRLSGMNPVEQQAALALKHLANLIIYVFDPTDTYPLPLQKKLYEKIKHEHHVPVIVYVSKPDLVEKIPPVPRPTLRSPQAVGEAILAAYAKTWKGGFIRAAT